MIYCDQKLSRQLEATEARANIDFVETRARLDPSYGAEWTEVGGAYAMFDGVESPLTQTFGLGIFQDATAEHLETIESFFKERGAPVFHEISPMADQSILPLLGERGYRPIELTSVMFRDMSSIDGNVDVAESEISTRQIEESEADVWAATSARGWATIHETLADFMLAFGKIAARTSHGHPFIAEIEGEAVGAAGFGIYDQVCILAGAATVPEARNRGVQNALLNARLQLAKKSGCSLAMICALPGSQSQKNAEKNGFKIAYTRIKWQLFE
ncbi:MAG: GNAT family N-acetyltransferase [bacterium]|nr:GNAT family N-acetyltransferase [bacterium]